MRFLVDESTGASVAALLRNLGHDVLVVAEAMSQAKDPEILSRAVAEGRIVVTNDKDFGELVYRAGQPHAGILLLRPQNETAASRVALVRAVLEQHADQLPGRFVVATETHVRVR